MGREGGGKDLNLGTPQPVRSAMRSESPRRWVSAAAPSSPPEARRSEKEVVMKGWEGKVKLGYEFAEVSKLPDEEAMKEERERELGFLGTEERKREINMNMKKERERRVRMEEKMVTYCPSQRLLVLLEPSQKHLVEV